MEPNKTITIEEIDTLLKMVYDKKLLATDSEEINKCKKATDSLLDTRIELMKERDKKKS
jgi:hypothetical protein